MICPRLILRCSLLVVLSATPRTLQAQRTAEVEAIQNYRFRVTETYADVNVEAEYQNMEAGDPAVSIIRHRILMQPVLGLGVNGSIYHPNFLNLNLSTELGLDWENSAEIPGEAESNSHFLQRYHGTLDIMRQQPYSTTLFADKDFTYRDYDFFTRVRVDSERYGGRTGYSAGPVPFTISAQHYEEVTEDPSRPTSLTENVITLNAHNHREAAQGETRLGYTLNDFTRQDNGYSTQKGLNQNLNVFDSETFGGGWVHLNSLLNFNSITETPAPNSKLLVQENLRLDHTPELTSFYDYVFDSSTAGDADSKSHQGRIGLTHQLFDNLTTTPDVHAYQASSASPGDWQETTRYGTSLTEQYTRPLGAWGNISAGYTGTIDRESRDANGQDLTVIDEFHTLSDAVVTLLNQPAVDTMTLRLTDPTRTILYVEGLDYLVLPRGVMTEIQRIPGGQIANGGVVLASYTARLQPSDDFWTYQNGVNFRIDFWKGLLGLYFRWIMVDYSGGDDLLLRTLDDKIFGVDSSWRWFRAGAEYEVQDSNLAPYDRVRLYQSASFRPRQGTVLSLDFDQSWSTFHENDMQERTAGFFLRSQAALAANLSWNTEAGLRFDRGDSYNRDLSVFRTSLKWAAGKLTVNMGYEYNRESQPSELNVRHYAFLRARRTF